MLNLHKQMFSVLTQCAIMKWFSFLRETLQLFPVLPKHYSAWLFLSSPQDFTFNSFSFWHLKVLQNLCFSSLNCFNVATPVSAIVAFPSASSVQKVQWLETYIPTPHSPNKTEFASIELLILSLSAAPALPSLQPRSSLTQSETTTVSYHDRKSFYFLLSTKTSNK